MSGKSQATLKSTVTVDCDGTLYQLESSNEDVPKFRVTNRETNETGTCLRDRRCAILNRETTLTHDMEEALSCKALLVIAPDCTREEVGDGIRREYN